MFTRVQYDCWTIILLVDLKFSFSDERFSFAFMCMHDASNHFQLSLIFYPFFLRREKFVGTICKLVSTSCLLNVEYGVHIQFMTKFCPMERRSVGRLVWNQLIQKESDVSAANWLHTLTKIMKELSMEILIRYQKVIFFVRLVLQKKNFDWQWTKMKIWTQVIPMNDQEIITFFCSSRWRKNVACEWRFCSHRSWRC